MNHDVRSLMARRRAPLALVGMLSMAACATMGTGAPGGTTTTTSTAQGDVAPRDQIWPVVTREHVDLWLHGFAMLTSDTARVPFFQRGYRQRMLDQKRKAN